MKFEIKLNKEQFVAIGKGAGKIGKAIIVEGTKAVALNGAKAVITQSFNNNSGGIKELGLDDLLNGGKKKKPKKAIFAFRKKKGETEGSLEAEVEIKTEVVEDTNETEYVEAELVQPVKKKTK